MKTFPRSARVIYVADTHPLVFWSSNRQRRLGNRARRILQETEQGKHSIIVPIVVLKEINCPRITIALFGDHPS